MNTLAGSAKGTTVGVLLIRKFSDNLYNDYKYVVVQYRIAVLRYLGTCLLDYFSWAIIQGLALPVGDIILP